MNCQAKCDFLDSTLYFTQESMDFILPVCRTIMLKGPVNSGKLCLKQNKVKKPNSYYKKQVVCPKSRVNNLSFECTNLNFQIVFISSFNLSYLFHRLLSDGF